MGNFDEVFERIKLVTNTKTQIELAEVLGIRQSSISDAKRRNSVPADWYMKLFEQFGLSPDWLKKGNGPMYLRTDHGYAPADTPAASILHAEVGRDRNPDAKNTVVTVYSTQPASNGDDDSAYPLGKLNIPLSFAGPGLHVVRLDGSSMEPYIHRGAYVGLDTTQKRVTSGELHGIRLPHEGLVIKRIFVDAQNDRLVLRSENPTLPEVYLPLKGYESHIVGRTVWVLQRL